MSPVEPVIAVIIPCYRVKKHILSVIKSIPAEVSHIVVVDDKCPENTGQFVEASAPDQRVTVVFHTHNQGVGGATISGYKEAIKKGATILIKMDGDGQMRPEGIVQLADPIIRGFADYTKGNRFFSLEHLRGMPILRLLGNTGLSFITKISSGYWNVMDPTNGFTALHAEVARMIPWEKIAPRYFFESDLLFRLNTLRAVVLEVPMTALYGDEESSMKISRILFSFPLQHASRFFKRLFYNYFLRDFNIASLQAILGVALMIIGIAFGADAWISNAVAREFASAGTVMLAALPIVLGFQLLLAAIGFDVRNVPRTPLHPLLATRSKKEWPLLTRHG